MLKSTKLIGGSLFNLQYFNLHFYDNQFSFFSVKFLVVAEVLAIKINTKKSYLMHLVITIYDYSILEIRILTKESELCIY